MANQVEVPKLNMNVAIGPSGAVSVSKLVMHVLLIPGESGPDTSGRQGHIHTQLISRR